MNNTPVEVFESLYNLIMSSPEDASEWSMEQWSEFSKRIHSHGRDTYDRLKELSKEFADLREKNLELEETVSLLHGNLDKQRKAMSDGDVESHRKACADQYGAFWNDLDTNSREFFITAHYLYERCQARHTDFSPVIIEFCRIFENELLVKLFTEFIQNQARINRIMSYEVRIFGKIENAVNSQNNDGSFFLSSMDMLRLLSYMNRSYTNNCYEKELQNHIRRKGFDTTKVSDRRRFIEPGESYVSNYRNEAAHPNFMQQSVAEACKDQTSTLVCQFIGAKH